MHTHMYILLDVHTNISWAIIYVQTNSYMFGSFILLPFLHLITCYLIALRILMCVFKMITDGLSSQCMSILLATHSLNPLFSKRVVQAEVRLQSTVKKASKACYQVPSFIIGKEGSIYLNQSHNLLNNCLSHVWSLIP